MNPKCPICWSQETSYFCKKNYYVFYRCAFCKLLFLHPLPSAKTLEALYGKRYDYEVDSVTLSRFEHQYPRIIDKIKDLSPKTRTLLDIGAGYGTFVCIAKQNGYTAMGLEPAKNLYRAARKKKINVINNDFYSFFKAHPHKSFDVISLIHVIEHLRDPVKALRLIVKHIKKNGVLYIETPNIDSHLFNIEQSAYTFLIPPEHIFLFSPESLKHVVQDVLPGAKTVINTYSYPEHMVGILRKIRHGQIGKPLSANGVGNHHKKNRPGKSAPYFDMHIAPTFLPLMNLGNKGSILQMYVQIQ